MRTPLTASPGENHKKIAVPDRYPKWSKPIPIFCIFGASEHQGWIWLEFAPYFAKHSAMQRCVLYSLCYMHLTIHAHY